jgi:GH25 family lysozyme M1 (1,4-beta-N-acetylmuramidase)
MTASSRIAIEGEVTLSTLVNVRSGDPSRTAAVAHKLPAGTMVRVHAIVIGEAVQGNAHWFETDQNSYVWAGACGPFVPSGAAPPAAAPAATPALATAHSADAGLGAAASPTGRHVPIVVDLSHHNRVTSFVQAFNAGVRGIIHKATTGADGRDDQYRGRRQPALDAGLLWGAYHWGNGDPVKQQVDNFLETAQPNEHTLVALDFEQDLHSQMTLQGAREFLEEIEQRLGRRAVLYSANTIKGALGTKQDAFFGSHRLWLAQYGPTPKTQLSWPTYWLWQYTDGTAGPQPRSAPGIPGNSAGAIDCDHFAGTEEELREQWAS